MATGWQEVNKITWLLLLLSILIAATQAIPFKYFWDRDYALFFHTSSPTATMPPESTPRNSSRNSRNPRGSRPARIPVSQHGDQPLPSLLVLMTVSAVFVMVIIVGLFIRNYCHPYGLHHRILNAILPCRDGPRTIRTRMPEVRAQKHDNHTIVIKQDDQQQEQVVPV